MVDSIKYLKINLDSGRKVTVENFSFQNTYGDYIQVSPDTKYINIDVFEKATCKSIYNTDRVLKIRPSDEEFEEGFKPFCFSVCLTSDPIDPIFCASELVVIWFADIPHGTTIEEIIQKGIGAIDWESNAKDFDF